MSRLGRSNFKKIDLLKDFEKADQEKEKAKKFAPIITEPEIPIVEYENKIPVVQFNSDNSNGIYSLQTGAYSVSKNAESQKINLIIAGFKARINELYKSNQTLYAVRIGHFDSKEDAQKVGAQIKAKLDLDTIVITNN